jgi:molecular chaperone GrpE
MNEKKDQKQENVKPNVEQTTKDHKKNTDVKKKIFGKKENKNDKIKELTDTLQRTQAEFVNFKNRTEKETRQILQYGAYDAVKKILPVIDSFELALKSNKDDSDFKKGIEMVYAQLLDILKQEGLVPINALNQKFDPYKHEVLMKGDSDKDSDIVIEELQKGFMFKDRVIRTSKVKISN